MENQNYHKFNREVNFSTDNSATDRPPQVYNPNRTPDKNLLIAPHRTLKNIFMAVGLIITLGLTTLTVCYALNDSSAAPAEQTSGQSTPPELPGSDTNNDSAEPPEKPDGEGSEKSTDPADSEKSTSSTKSTDPTESDNSTEPPAKPDDEDNTNSSSSRPNNIDNNMSDTANPSDNGANNNNSTNLSLSFYIAFAIEGLIFALLTLYLIMSRANRQTWHQTFHNADKIIIFLLATAVITTVYTAAAAYLATHLTLSSSEPTTNDTTTSYNAVFTIDTDANLTDHTYISSDSGQLAILATGNLTAALDNFTINKTGDGEDGDSTNFYGTNSAILAMSGANLTIKNSTITTDADGANGVFSFGGSATTDNNATNSGDGTTINISDSTITTSQDNSGGLMTTGGGIMNATNLTINTAGTSSAAIRSDRGGGTVTVDQGTYATTGQGSPAIYSTADITVKNATLTSEASEGIVIEGKNSVSLDNIQLTDNNTKLNGQSTTYKNIFLYQSMSGDAADGTATFTAKNSQLITNKGDSFYVTNTTAEINLENNIVVNNDTAGNFLRVQADSWGNSGSNGGIVTMNLTNQTINGNIVIDDISELTLNLTNGSSFTGAINTANSAKSLTLQLSADSSLTLTADAYVTALKDADATHRNINFNGHKLYVNGTALN